MLIVLVVKIAYVNTCEILTDIYIQYMYVYVYISEYPLIIINIFSDHTIIQIINTKQEILNKIFDM